MIRKSRKKKAVLIFRTNYSRQRALIDRILNIHVHTTNTEACFREKLIFYRQ